MGLLNRAAGNGAPCRPTSRDQYKSHWSIPMKLRRNEYLPDPPIAVLLRSRAGAERTQISAWCSAHRRSAPPEGISRTPVASRDAEAAEPKDRRAGREMRNLSRRPLRTTTRLCPTTSSPKAWEGPGETTIPTTFKQSIGGAISKRGRGGLFPDKPLDQRADEAINNRLKSICERTSGNAVGLNADR